MPVRVAASVPSLLTQAEAADACAVSVRTIRRWIAAGMLPARRVGPRLVRIDAADLLGLGRPLNVAAPRVPTR